MPEALLALGGNVDQHPFSIAIDCSALARSTSDGSFVRLPHAAMVDIAAFREPRGHG
jgi:hypothetical protein